MDSNSTSSVDTSLSVTFFSQVAVAVGEAVQVVINIVVLGLAIASDIRGTLSFSAILSALLADILANVILLFVFIPGIPSFGTQGGMIARLAVVALRWISIESMALLAWILNQAVCHWQSFRVSVILLKVRLLVASTWAGNLVAALLFWVAKFLVQQGWQRNVVGRCYFAVDVASRVLPLVVIVAYYVKILFFSKRLKKANTGTRSPLQQKIAFSRAMMAITAFKILGLLTVTIQSYVTDNVNVIAIQVVKMLSSVATLASFVSLCAPVRDLVFAACLPRSQSRAVVQPAPISTSPLPFPPGPSVPPSGSSPPGARVWTSMTLPSEVPHTQGPVPLEPPVVEMLC